ncbi:MAG: saccharopine dehydrogenase NADP-binding domain-containing protein [Xanthomonadales bacterium]|nr:saccharopine dehydrogenase NADP-binding domain-containing protein [Xanthomonadales bacterium]
MKKPILVVGGYGVVGLQIAQVTRKQNVGIPIIIAGRSINKASEAAAKIKNASGIALDVSDIDPLANVNTEVGAVICAVNDPDDALMRAAITRGIPYIDITRWTVRLHSASLLASVLDITAPVVLSSSWMAGVCAIVAKKATTELGVVEEIDTAILYRLADKAGPNSVEYADRLGIPFRVLKNGRWKTVKPMSEPLQTTFPGGYSGKAYRFDEPSQETLALYTGAETVSSRIAYDSVSTTRVMALLVKSGIWGLISGPSFTKFRHSMLHNPGAGASHEVVILVKGKGATGKEETIRATILDPEGQTHLTAVGAYIQLSETLGLDGQAPRAAGVYLPENTNDPQSVIKTLEQNGVKVNFEVSPL